ncbi:MAG: hypothetical protein IPK74_12690 [Deltaproteobacteria bacterium]|nr:hypothetical protein [Deltaproteobacteria bacterium]
MGGIVRAVAVDPLAEQHAAAALVHPVLDRSPQRIEAKREHPTLRIDRRHRRPDHIHQRQRLARVRRHHAQRPPEHVGLPSLRKVAARVDHRNHVTRDVLPLSRRVHPKLAARVVWRLASARPLRRILAQIRARCARETRPAKRDRLFDGN